MKCSWEFFCLFSFFSDNVVVVVSFIIDEDALIGEHEEQIRIGSISVCLFLRRLRLLPCSFFIHIPHCPFSIRFSILLSYRMFVSFDCNRELKNEVETKNSIPMFWKDAIEDERKMHGATHPTDRCSCRESIGQNLAPSSNWHPATDSYSTIEWSDIVLQRHSFVSNKETYSRSTFLSVIVHWKGIFPHLSTDQCDRGWMSFDSTESTIDHQREDDALPSASSLVSVSIHRLVWTTNVLVRWLYHDTTIHRLAIDVRSFSGVSA